MVSFVFVFGVCSDRFSGLGAKSAGAKSAGAKSAGAENVGGEKRGGEERPNQLANEHPKGGKEHNKTHSTLIKLWVQYCREILGGFFRECNKFGKVDIL